MTEYEDRPTHDLVFSKEENVIIRYVLQTAEDSDTDIYELTDLIHETMGMNVAFHGGTEEFHENPPSPEELQDIHNGQRMEVTIVQLEALQTCISYFIFAMTKQGEAPTDIMDEITGIHDKISEAWDDLRATDPEYENTDY